MQYQIYFHFLLGLTGLGSLALALFEWRKLKSNRFPAVWLILGGCLIFSSLPAVQDILGNWTSTLRARALKDEWYENRRIFQEMILLTGGLVGILSAIAAIGVMWRVAMKYAWAVIAIASVSAMNAIVLISDHFTDAVIVQQIGGVNLYYVSMRYLSVLALAAVCWGWFCTLAFLRTGKFPGYFNPPKRTYFTIRVDSALAKKLFEVHVWLIALTVFLASQETFVINKWLSMSAALLNALVYFGVTLPIAKLKEPFHFMRRAPLLILCLCFYFFCVYLGRLTQLQLPQTDGWLTLVMLLSTGLVCSSLYSLKIDGGSLLKALATAGILLSLEGLFFELRSTHGLKDVFQYSPFRRDISVENMTRLWFPFTQGNNFGTALNIFITCCYFNFFQTKNLFARSGWLLAVALMLGVMALIGCRGALILFVPLTIAVFAREFKVLRVPAVCFSVIISAGIAWALRKPFTRLRSTGSLRQRAHQWVATSHILQRNPLFGGGANAFEREWKTYGPAHYYANDFGADSFYAGLLSEGGIVGLALLTALCGCTIWEVGRLQSSDAPKSLRDAIFYLALALGCVLLHNVIQPNLGRDFVLLFFTILFGMIVGVKSNLQKIKTS